MYIPLLFITLSMAMPIHSPSSSLLDPFVILEDQVYEKSLEEPFQIVRGFKETYKQLKRVKGKDPLEWKRNNPLSTHDATKDQQAALRQWFTWFDRIGPRALKFRFNELLNNPTVDFSINDFKALKLVAHLGDEEAVSILLNKFSKEISDVVRNQTLIRAVLSHKKRLVVSLVEDYGIQPNLNTFVAAVQCGDLQITKYLQEKLNFTSISFFIMHCARLSGNMELVKFLANVKINQILKTNDVTSESKMVQDIKSKVPPQETLFASRKQPSRFHLPWRKVSRSKGRSNIKTMVGEWI